ncbi:MAG: ribonuclease Z [Nanoarchaeota archaeon]
MIRIVFLGTSDAVPSEKRNHTAVFFSYNNENILMDCGEGTQRQIRIAKLNPCSITKILISHWHGDHVLGIPGLLQSMALNGYNKQLDIYGPEGTKKFIEEIFNLFVFASDKLNIKVHEVNGKFFENDDFFLISEKMSHGCPSNAYSFVLKEKIRIDKKKLKKYKIDAGPWLQDLKKGKDITYNKRKIKSKDVTFLQNGKKISIIMDTGFNNKILPFVKDADLLISESSFLDEDSEKAKLYKHLTAKQAAETAKKAKVKKLILTHVSQRYTKNIGKVEKEARKIFKNSKLAEDFMEIIV